MRIQKLETRVAAVEQQVEHVEQRLKTLESLAVELALLKTLVGDLKFEIEQMQEA